MHVLVLATLLFSPGEAVKKVVGAIASAATENAAKAGNGRQKGDALTDLYVRRACSSGQPGKAVVLGLAYALDAHDLFVRSPIFGSAFKNLETPEERKARLAAQGTPTLRGREDWLAHFIVSAGLTVLAGAQSAEWLGIQKEVSDARGKEKGHGSGFSFTDLSADLAGIAFARWLTGERCKEAIAACGSSFTCQNFVPDPRDLRDGLSWAEFVKSYGSLEDPRFLEECQKLRARVQGCRGYE